MAAVWGASWGVSWGSSWGSAAAAVSAFVGGRRITLPTRAERAAAVRKQREELGILPKPARAAIRVAVKRVIATKQLAAPILRQELARRDIEWSLDYLKLAQAMADALRPLKIEQRIARQAAEQAAIQAQQRKRRQRDDEEFLLILALM